GTDLLRDAGLPDRVLERVVGRSHPRDPSARARAHQGAFRGQPRLTPATLSLVALLLAIVFSCTSRVNVGVLAFALAWVLGVLGGGGSDLVVKTFPAQLFVTLAGVTLLFALAESNGTLERLATAA